MSEKPMNRLSRNTTMYHLISTSQQKKRYRDLFEIYFYAKTKTIVYYDLRQCLHETRLSPQNKQ
jgi:hypothetical protein